MLQNLIQKRQYFISIISIVLVAAMCYPFREIIGYRTVALILLMTVSLLAMRLSLYPILTAAVLSALIWDFFFIEPHFTLHVSNTEDALLLIMYFFIALLNGVLTSRIRHFEKLAQQREERNRAIKLYDTLFNAISHEFRTPIATIMGASENLLYEEKLKPEFRQKLYEEINKASFRLNKLVDNLLNMSRLDSGTIQAKLDWCDLNELIYATKNRLADELKTHQVIIKIPKNLPLFQLDFGMIEQAIYNILYNASVYTPEGSAIEIHADYIDNQCVMTIADNGKGFPKEEINQVFEKFYRTKGSQTGGLGLGLSITKGFIEAHNGNIKVENQKGSGAKFTIKIPAKPNYGTDFSSGLML